MCFSNENLFEEFVCLSNQKTEATPGEKMQVHNITFKGYSGVSFILVMIALIFYVLAFGSGAWAGEKDGDVWTGAGLWSECQNLGGTGPRYEDPGNTFALC